jgi:hypothetical protein
VHPRTACAAYSRERSAPVCHCTIWIDLCRFLKRTDRGGMIETVQ